MSGERWEHVLNQKIQEEMDALVSSRLQHVVDCIMDHTESPIERIMAATFATLGPTWGEPKALCFLSRSMNSIRLSSMLTHVGQDAVRASPFLADGNWTGFIVPQAIHDPYRLDFLFGAVFCDDGQGFPQCLLAVECDGHDFHERTKEQAARDRARDRALQAEGLVVFRFTGSQIYNDPFACAAEIRAFIEAWSAPYEASYLARINEEFGQPELVEA